MGSGFSLDYSGIVDAAGVIAAVTIVGSWFKWGVEFVPNRRSALLALPGAIAIVYYFGSALPRYLTHQAGVADYVRFCQPVEQLYRFRQHSAQRQPDGNATAAA